MAKKKKKLGRKKQSKQGIIRKGTKSHKISKTEQLGTNTQMWFVSLNIQIWMVGWWNLIAQGPQIGQRAPNTRYNKREQHNKSSKQTQVQKEEG
ncbi:hypothetical protein JGG43_23740 [Salmonella enterica subsp. enterica serovar Typhimurium]|nr:hypothetical protein [Salmonella enterica subsp. enterica serovar Typhimurium]